MQTTPLDPAQQTAQIIGFVIALLAASWVVADCVKRGKSGLAAFGWGAGVLLVLIVFLPLYLFQRAKEGTDAPGQAKSPIAAPPCRYCGGAVEGDPAYCPHCGKQLKSSMDIHKSV